MSVSWISIGYSGHENVLGLACGDPSDGDPPHTEPELDLFDPARFP